MNARQGKEEKCDQMGDWSRGGVPCCDFYDFVGSPDIRNCDVRILIAVGSVGIHQS